MVLNARARAGKPFVVLGVLAIIAGGLVSGATAHEPSRFLMWLVAYLVLVVGAMQIVFGAGQAWLAVRLPGFGVIWGQWVVFNLGNAGVILGTYLQDTALVALGTLLFALALLWFLYATRQNRWRVWGVAYRALLGLLFLSSCVGVVLSIVS